MAAETSLKSIHVSSVTNLVVTLAYKKSIAQDVQLSRCQVLHFFEVKMRKLVAPSSRHRSKEVSSKDVLSLTDRNNVPNVSSQAAPSSLLKDFFIAMLYEML